MRTFTKIAAFATLASVLAAGMVGAASAAPGKAVNSGAAPIAAPTDTAVNRFRTATELAATARSLRDPYLMASAARMIIEVGGIPATDTGKDGAADAGKPPTGPSNKPVGEARPLAERLFAEAEAYARSNATAMAYVRSARSASSRSVMRPPHRHEVELQAGRYIDLTEEFRGSQVAEVGVVGDGDTDVDLVIYDSNGNRVCVSTREGDREYCRFTPAWTGTYTVRVSNYGRVYNSVTVLLNN